MNRLGAFVLASAACFITPLGTAAASGPTTSVLKPASAIRHLVVMTQGGRSFDNYFGVRKGVDGIPPRACQLRSTLSQPRCVTPFALGTSATPLPLRSTAQTQVASINRGGMNGFVRAQKTRDSDGVSSLGYYRTKDLPLMNELADRGVLFDHWFSGVPGGTVPNRLFGVTAQVQSDRTEVPSAGWADTPVIFDRLTAAGVSWRIYVQNYEPALTIATASTKQRLGGQVARMPLLAMKRYTDDPAAMSHIVDLSQYYRDLSTGKLPAVSYVVSTSSTEQSPQSPVKGSRLSRAVVNALIASTAWSRSAFLLQYDSSGGWYDHVQPPRIDGKTVGLRVPALLISPFARPGTVEHGNFDAASTLKFIEKIWQVAPLAARDRAAADLTTAFSFAHQPTPATLVGVPTDRSVLQPDRVLLYLGYGAAILIATALMVGVVWTTTVRDRLARAASS